MPEDKTRKESEEELEEKKKYRVVDRRFMNKDGEIIETPPEPPKQEQQSPPKPDQAQAPEPDSEKPEAAPRQEVISRPDEADFQDDQMDEGAEERELARVQDILRYFVSVMITQASLNLGFIADPRTQQTKLDLPEAKLAIDAVHSLFELLQPHLSKQERKEIERILADLKIEFVNRSK